MKMKTSISFGASRDSTRELLMSTFEKHLGTLAGEEPGTRIELVQVADPGETPTVEFRYQRECDSLGWVTHRRMRMAAGQVGDLRSALNLMDPDGRDAESNRDSADVEALFEVVPGGKKQKSSG